MGIYGIISYTVAQRTHEFGVRFALGARKADVAGLVLTWVARLTLIAIVLGLTLAWALTRLISGLLEGVSPTDPATFAIVAGLLFTMALFASWLPARRAARVGPMAALRQE